MTKFEVDVWALNQTKGGTDFSANDRCEMLTFNALCYGYALLNKGPTIGNVPEYDWTVQNTKIEQKVSKNKTMYIEFEKYDGTPSGLAVTESDIHMFVNPAKVKIDSNWTDIMKVRLVHTYELERWLDNMLANHENEMKVYEPDKLGKGSKGFFLDFKDKSIDDLYVMGFNYRMDNGHIVFDTARPIMPESTYAANNIRKYIP